MSKKIAFEKEQAIIKDILSRNFTIKDISLMHKVSPSTINNIMKRNDIEFSYYIDDIFSNIDTEEKAYWIGFFYADGSLDDKRNSIEIGLKSEDFYHLEKLKKLLGHNIGTVRCKPSTNSCRYTIIDKQIYNDVKKTGLYANKSLTIKFYDVLKNIPEELHNHFIRGIFDGDGSIMYIPPTEKRGVRILSGITGNKYTVEEINEYLNLKIGTTLVKVHNKKGTNAYHTQWCKNDTLKIIKYLYDNSSIFLQRKFEIAVLCRNT